MYASLLQGGDLQSVISRRREEGCHVEESMVWRVLRQLLLALQECHKKRDGVHKVCSVLYYAMKLCTMYIYTYCPLLGGCYVYCSKINTLHSER